MAGSIMGETFRVVNWGESHGVAIGAVVLGCPAGLEVSEEMIQPYLDQRRPGDNELTSTRDEPDIVSIMSGVYEGQTTGTPISLMILNEDQRSGDYKTMRQTYRPGHASQTYDEKYGIYDPLGGGRSSGRLTAPTVAAGAIARLIIPDTQITAYIVQIGDIEATIEGPISDEMVYSNSVRCPDPIAAVEMDKIVRQARRSKESIGGVIECVVTNPPRSLGEPVYDRLDSALSGAMVSIPGVKGFEVGSGFESVMMLGSQHNDIPIVGDDGRASRATNNAGGIEGGISNGMPIVFRVPVRPTATIAKEQPTITRNLEPTTIEGKGRHDPCIALRAVAAVAGYTACVLADMSLRNRSSRI